jgi:hypothetical protein
MNLWNLPQRLFQGPPAKSKFLTLLAVAGVAITPPAAAEQDWVKTSLPALDWSSVACSADGERLVAVADHIQEGAVYTSEDSGQTWVQTDAPARAWTGAASSADGMKLVIAGNDFPEGPVYLSKDAGATWNSAGAPPASYTSAATSADGSYIILGANEFPSGALYVSSDSGLTWTTTPAPFSAWTSVASSANGLKLFGVSNSGSDGPVYSSANGGRTWTHSDAMASSWMSVACSADGSRALIASNAFPNGTIYRTTNSGTTWTDLGRGGNNWSAVAMSADGTHLVVASALINGNSGDSYLSSDSGATWRPSGLPAQAWSSLASSADGRQVVAAARGDGIYILRPTITMVTDTDYDGIPNDWETAHGTNPNADDAAADPDSDGLSNLEEYWLGTHPTAHDTDADGLLDDAEDLFGTWTDASATGTDPLNPDTDGDGLLDGMENPDLSYAGPGQPGTDPHRQDTDGDGLPDLAEITHGSDPTAEGDVAVFSYSSTVLADNFDGLAVNSTYAFTRSAGTFAPGKIASGLSTNGDVVRLTDLSGGISNSVAWDTVPSLANAVRVTFDFRMSADPGGEAADGFGIGFFKTASHGTTGPANPGYRPTDDVVWENPTYDSGFPGGVVVGFDIYGGTTEGNTVRVTGPLARRPAAASAVPSFQLNEGVFHRVTITAIKNGPDSTALSVEITRDVNEARPTRFSLVKGVVVKGFDISTDPFRLIAGGRTGGSTVMTDLDNLSVVSSTVLPPPTVLVSHDFNRTTDPPEFVITWTSGPGLEYAVEASTDLGATSWNVVQETVPSGGETTTTAIPVPAGSPAKNFYRVRLKP